ncbi:hypothetical protein NIES4071_08650 [Calothrix sp. NIES-4071]|nr:hypothetical protein NIES4071_08650 [Calothrix sp. NIES-4071]BAZ55207.1 hypothetical protein NIES4105_08610 [Calothrix sp. NIES-4105]
MNNSTFQLIQRYSKEYTITGILGSIPTPIGRIIRELFYKLIFERVFLPDFSTINTSSN